MVTSVIHAHAVRNYSVQIKFEGKIFLWVQLIHENITQQINFKTKLSQTNISQTTVYCPYSAKFCLVGNYDQLDQENFDQKFNELDHPYTYVQRIAGEKIER